MYVLGAILALTLVLQAVTAVIDSVLDLVKLKPVINKIPIIGAHWGLGVSLVMVWVAKLEPLNNWVAIKDQHWLHIVINGAVSDFSCSRQNGRQSGPPVRRLDAAPRDSGRSPSHPPESSCRRRLRYQGWLQFFLTQGGAMQIDRQNLSEHVWLFLPCMFLF